MVEFKDQQDKTDSVAALGQETHAQVQPPFAVWATIWEAGLARWALCESRPEFDNVVLISDALANIEPKPEQWLNKDFFKVEKVRAWPVAFPVATNSWKLARETETGEWKLADAKPGEQLDAQSLQSCQSAQLSELQRRGHQIQARATRPGQAHRRHAGHVRQPHLHAESRRQDQRQLSPDPDRRRAAPEERTPGKDEKPEDKEKLDKEFKEKQKKLEEKLAQEKAYEKWTYLVSSWTLEPLLKERSQFMVEKKEEKKEDPRQPRPSPPRRCSPCPTPCRLPRRPRPGPSQFRFQAVAKTPAFQPAFFCGNEAPPAGQGRVVDAPQGEHPEFPSGP